MCSFSCALTPAVCRRLHLLSWYYLVHIAAVQPHLRKCFDAIAELIFAEGSLGDILGMKSGEDEEVPFSNVVQARGNVEDWLRDVESMMRLTLYNLLSDANQASVLIVPFPLLFLLLP